MAFPYSQVNSDTSLVTSSCWIQQALNYLLDIYILWVCFLFSFDKYTGREQAEWCPSPAEILCWSWHSFWLDFNEPELAHTDLPKNASSLLFLGDKRKSLPNISYLFVTWLGKIFLHWILCACVLALEVLLCRGKMNQKIVECVRKLCRTDGKYLLPLPTQSANTLSPLQQ